MKAINKIVDYKKATRRLRIVGLRVLLFGKRFLITALLRWEKFSREAMENLQAAVDFEIISGSQANGMSAAYKELREISLAPDVSI